VNREEKEKRKIPANENREQRIEQHNVSKSEL